MLFCDGYRVLRASGCAGVGWCDGRSMLTMAAPSRFEDEEDYEEGDDDDDPDHE